MQNITLRRIQKGSIDLGLSPDAFRPTKRTVTERHRVMGAVPLGLGLSKLGRPFSPVTARARGDSLAHAG